MELIDKNKNNWRDKNIFRLLLKEQTPQAIDNKHVVSIGRSIFSLSKFGHHSNTNKIVHRHDSVLCLGSHE